MLKTLWPKKGSDRRNLLPKWATASVLVLAFAITTSAYTLVFRNGNRMEIPAEFTLTSTTLTYEIAPGFNKTLQLILIDVAATERANKEAPGSFFKRREEKPVVTDPAPQAGRTSTKPAPQATRTLTNSDLVAIRQRREDSEKNYEARRKELGLPTVGETRRRQQQEEAAWLGQVREQSFAKAREEKYWRDRARELRTEIALVDTQISYLRGRLSELNESSPVTGSFSTIYPSWPDYGQRSGDGRWGNRSRRGPRQAPPVFGPPQYPYGYPNGQNPYGYPNGQYPYGYPNGQYPYGYPNGQYPYGYPNGQYPYGYPNGQNPYGYPMGTPDNVEKSAQRSDLTYRLDDLLIKRTGLAAQWRALEDEARDARVPQIWLEP